MSKLVTTARVALTGASLVALCGLAPGAASAQDVAPLADPIRNCGPAPADIDSSAWGTPFDGSVNMRRSPNTTSQICGVALRTHRADYHCYTVGAGGTWTYVRNATTTYAGWVRDDLLTDGGSFDRC